MNRERERECNECVQQNEKSKEEEEKTCPLTKKKAELEGTLFSDKRETTYTHSHTQIK